MPDALRPALEAAVPLWIGQARSWTAAARIAAAQHDGNVIAHHGDAIMYKSRDTAAAFTALARGLAMAAFQPGGVTFAGLHWEAAGPDPEPGVQDAAAELL